MKPVLRKKGVPPAQSTPSQELVEYVKQVVKPEIDRKDYKDRAREAYDNFGQFSAQKAVLLTKSEYEQRKILLGKVKQFWIEGFLKPSLQGVDAIYLDLKARPDAIADLTQGIEALSVELDASYEKLRDTKIYDEIGQGRTLLILGEPGAGKTIALLQLAQRLIDRSEQDLSLPIPVVLNLSSWARDRKSIVDWAIDELREKYQVPKSLSDPWIRQQQLILLLDGLDEVQEEYRNDCVRALNEFIGLFPQTEVAVCSRVRDYEALTERLQISSALCLQPLSSEQVYQSLDRVGGSLAGVKALLKRDAELEQSAQTPLILNFMSVAYQGWSVEELISQLRSTTDRNEHLFDTYIDRRLKQGAAPEYSQEQVLRWLSWLAGQMLQKKQTIFLIEKMQPTWLQDRSEEKAYQIRTLLFSVVISGFNGWLVGWLTIWLISGLNLGNMEIIAYTPVVSGLTAMIIGGIVTVLQKEILPLEQLSWSWQRAKSRWMSELFTGIIFGLILGLILWLIHQKSIGLGFGLISGLIVGQFFGLGSGLGSSEIIQRTFPNQGIRSSVRNCWIVGLSFGLIGGLSSGLISMLFVGNQMIIRIGLIGGLSFGLISMLKYGGTACNQHLILRYMLYRKGRIPWNYAKFLDFASEHLLMKKVGGGYVFFHRMLLEHFARMNPN